MRRASKIIAGILLALIMIVALLAAGLSFYLTDERLRSMAEPHIAAMTDRTVEVEDLSYTLFSTFPRFGLRAGPVRMSDPVEDELASLQRIRLDLEIWPLLRNEVQVNRLELQQPEISVVRYADGTTNLDDAFHSPERETREPDPDEEQMLFDLQRITVEQGSVRYVDHQGDHRVSAAGLDMDTAVRIAEIIESDVDLQIGSLGLMVEGQPVLDGLTVRLSQTSELDTEHEELRITSGSLDLHGLALVMEGAVSRWSEDNAQVDLDIHSESDDFGALMDMIPETYDDLLQGVDAGGQLEIEAGLGGWAGPDSIPSFTAHAVIEDGHIQHTDMPEQIRDISLQVEAGNNEITLHSVQAAAGASRIEAEGNILHAFDRQAEFRLISDGELDLSTAARVYPLESEWGVEQLGGTGRFSVSAEGRLWEPEESRFNAAFMLTDGLLAHAELAHPVEQIHVDLEGSRGRIRLQSLQANMQSNRVDLGGVIHSPLEHTDGSFDMEGELVMDLESLYPVAPVDRDTLDASGILRVAGSVSGPLDAMDDPDQVEPDLQASLEGGHLAWHEWQQPLETLTLDAHVLPRTLTVNHSRVETGGNRLQLSGQVTDYRSENPHLALQLNGRILLEELDGYIDMDAFDLQAAGEVEANLGIDGPVEDPLAIQLNGPVTIREGEVRTPGLPEPVTGMNGTALFQGDDIQLQEFHLDMGRSDFRLSGSLQRYRALMDEPGEAAPAGYQGSLQSDVIDLDEMLDADPDTEQEEYPVHLPNLEGEMEGRIDVLHAYGITAEHIEGKLVVTPDYIAMPEGRVDIYDGTLEGEMTWQVPDPERTRLAFSGKLDDMSVESLFADFDLGGNLRLNEYVSARFSADTDYASEMDVYLEPDVESASATGSFGMDEARLDGHPVQEAMAGFLNAEALNNLALDQWRARYEIADGVLHLEDMNLTSRDIGVNLNGTQHLIDQTLDYHADVVLPGSLADGLADYISEQGVEALKREDGHVSVPVSITGTTDEPEIGMNREIVEQRVEEYLTEQAEEAGRGLLDSILDRNR